jgi:hypothetical protein
MTTQQIKRIEKIAEQSLKYAKQAIKKSDELHALLSLMQYKAGKKKEYSSVNALFKKLKIS